MIMKYKKVSFLGGIGRKRKRLFSPKKGLDGDIGSYKSLADAERMLVLAKATSSVLEEGYLQVQCASGGIFTGS